MSFGGGQDRLNLEILEGLRGVNEHLSFDGWKQRRWSWSSQFSAIQNLLQRTSVHFLCIHGSLLQSHPARWAPPNLQIIRAEAKLEVWLERRQKRSRAPAEKGLREGLWPTHSLSPLMQQRRLDLADVGWRMIRWPWKLTSELPRLPGRLQKSTSTPASSTVFKIPVLGQLHRPEGLDRGAAEWLVQVPDSAQQHEVPSTQVRWCASELKISDGQIASLLLSSLGGLKGGGLWGIRLKWPRLRARRTGRNWKKPIRRG